MEVIDNLIVIGDI